MGRPRVKIIDDSQPAEEVKKTFRSFGKKGGDSLVESLKEELGIEKEKLDVGSESPEANLAKGGNLEKEVRGSKLEDQTSNIQPPKPISKIQHPTSKSKPRSKKYQESIKTLEAEIKPEDADENYSYKQSTYKLPDAIDMVKKLSYARFNDSPGTLEAHINTTQTGIRGLISLPFASGKKIRILAFGKGAEQSGADIFGDDSTLDEIAKGKIDFDLLITTPDWMPKLAKVAKILGPRGLMPNPKAGTITEDLKKAVESFQAGKTEYKTEAKGKVIHLPMGKLNQPGEELTANVKTLLQTLGKTRISKVTLSPTMGAAVKVDITSI